MEENGLERGVTYQPIETPEESEISKNNKEAFNKLRDLFAIKWNHLWRPRLFFHCKS